MLVFERDDLALHLLDEEGSSGRSFTNSTVAGATPPNPRASSHRRCPSGCFPWTSAFAPSMTLSE